MDQTDWHDQLEKTFLEKLVGRLNAAVEAGEAKKLILIAPPRALGVIRQAYTPILRNAVHAELDKDYVKLPVHEIEKHLAG
jgi:protein required for attachment to host cells